MEYSRTRQIPDRIVIQEKTGLPNYVDQRIGHHIPNDGLHFHGNIQQRQSAIGNDSGIYGGRHETETKVRNIPTFQSSIFTKHNYEQKAGSKSSGEYPFERNTRGAQASSGHVGNIDHTTAQRQDRELKAAIRSNGRADHVDILMKPNFPEPKIIPENTTYKTKHAVDGFARHHSPFKAKEPAGKINSTHWNANHY